MVYFVAHNDIQSKALELTIASKLGIELKKTFWNELFGSLTDKFGISWMISVKEQG